MKKRMNQNLPDDRTAPFKQEPNPKVVLDDGEVRHAAALFSKICTEAKSEWLEKKMRSIAPPSILRAMDVKWLDKVQKWMEKEGLQLEEVPSSNTTLLMRGKEVLGEFRVVYKLESKKYFVEQK